MVCEEKKLEAIKNLISLQDCDFRVKEIKRRKAEGPARLKTLETDLKLLENQMDEELSKIDSIKRERRKIEQDIQDLEGRIKKSGEKLANIKSNKEYGAALKEIAKLEREKTQLEDRALEIMEEIEAIEAKCAASKEKRIEFQRKFEQDQKEVKEELKTLDGELESYENQRLGIRKEIDATLLKQYDNIGGHKGGIAVSSVIKGVCQACHLGIPPQKFNELMRGDVLMNCPHCMRIIYWGEDERYKGKV